MNLMVVKASTYIHQYKLYIKNNMDLNDLLRDMDTYVHTPVDKDGRPVFPVGDHQTPQHHSGNLGSHARWTMATISWWKDTSCPIVNGVDENEARLAALLHDVGKGGDCVRSCTIDGCWKDVYSPLKNPDNHPTRCGDIIMGRAKYVINCQTRETFDLNRYIITQFPNIDVRRIGVAVYAHSDLGPVNMPPYDMGSMVEKYIAYLNKFYDHCEKCGIEPSESLLRLCLAVQAADIRGTTNRHLRSDPRRNDDLHGSYESHVPKDPWLAYEMDKRVLWYHQAILITYRESLSIGAV